jgi:hypothetical protein
LSMHREICSILEKVKGKRKSRSSWEVI